MDILDVESNLPLSANRECYALLIYTRGVFIGAQPRGGHAWSGGSDGPCVGVRKHI